MNLESNMPLKAIVRERPLTPEVILDTDDVIFAEVGACLNLYKDELFSSSVMDAMCNTDTKADFITGSNLADNAIECDFSVASDDKPMLGALFVALI